MAGKVLLIPDIHIASSNIASVVDYQGECEMIMDKIVRIVEDRKPDYVIFLGDIFHKQNLSIEMLMKTIKFFGELHDLTNVYAIRGNHDLQGKNNASYFDILVTAGLINREEYIKIDEVILILADFIELNSQLFKLIQEIKQLTNLFNWDNIKAILLMHNAIIFGQRRNQLYNDMKNLFRDTVYINVMHDEVIDDLEGGELADLVDLIIAGHVHFPYGLVEVKTDDPFINKRLKSILYPGSLARTIYNESSFRDFGNIVELSINGSDIEVNLIKVDLTPYMQYFNMLKIKTEREKEYLLNEFVQKVESLDLKFLPIDKLIDNLDIDEEVKIKCRELLYSNDDVG